MRITHKPTAGEFKLCPRRGFSQAFWPTRRLTEPLKPVSRLNWCSSCYMMIAEFRSKSHCNNLDEIPTSAHDSLIKVVRLPPSGGSRDQTSLRRLSPQKREYPRSRPETFGDFHLKIGELRVRRRSKFAQSRDFRPTLTLVGEPGRTHEWVVGAGGFEPRDGELEIGRSRLPERGRRTSSVEIHK